MRLHWGAEEKLRKTLGISGLVLKLLLTRLEAEMPAIRGRVSTEEEEGISKDELQAYDKWNVETNEHETSNYECEWRNKYQGAGEQVHLICINLHHSNIT